MADEKASETKGGGDKAAAPKSDTPDPKAETNVTPTQAENARDSGVAGRDERPAGSGGGIRLAEGVEIVPNDEVREGVGPAASVGFDGDTSAFVGVSPEYRNYAGVGGQPFQADEGSGVEATMERWHTDREKTMEANAADAARKEDRVSRDAELQRQYKRIEEETPRETPKEKLAPLPKGQQEQKEASKAAVAKEGGDQ